MAIPSEKPDLSKEPASDVASARRSIETERAGLDALSRALGLELAEPFQQAIDIIRAASGRVIVSGMGKSGHVGGKIAATLASTGTPAFFVHPAEASHGDLGMIMTDDVVMALSWSGETTELRNLIEYTRRWDIALIGVTSVPTSSVGRESDVVLALPKIEEACPHGLAPTTSALIQLALGDALAIALLEGRPGFTPESYHKFHPGGRLGADLNYVSKIMHRGPSVPLAPIGRPMSEAIIEMTGKGLGCLGIVDSDGLLVGIITDGDLRRHLGPDLLSQPVEQVMTASPKTIRPDALVGAAIDILNQPPGITVLFVVKDNRPVGVVHMHDLLRIGVA